MKEEMMQAPEVGRLMGISTTTVYKWMKEHKLPKPYIINGRYYWERREIYRRWNVREGI